MESKITKTMLLKKCNNEKQFCWYYLVYAYKVNEIKTKYKKLKFVVQLDIFDMQGYFDKDFITEKEQREYLEEMAYNFLDNYNYENITSACNDTITRYNNFE